MVLELTRTGESCAQNGTLEGLLRETLDLTPEHPIFIPARTYDRKGTKVTIHLMEGYCFVATGLAETVYFALEKECPYVKKVLSSEGPNGMSVLQVISNAKIEEMRTRLQEVLSAEIEVGMQVLVLEGTYAKLEGEVVGIADEDAHVHIQMRSFETIRSIPRVFLEPVGEEDTA